VEVGSESATVSDVQDVLYTYRYRRQNPACGWIERDIYTTLNRPYYASRKANQNSLKM
jgi:hypothetical protein